MWLTLDNRVMRSAFGLRTISPGQRYDDPIAEWWSWPPDRAKLRDTVKYLWPRWTARWQGCPAPGSRLNIVQRQALMDVVESSPVSALHGSGAVATD
jgi:hypothetical protein